MTRNFSQRLKEVLFLLVSEPNIQMNAFPDFVHIPDEIAAETSDAIIYAPNQISQEDARIIDALRNIDALFVKMAEDAHNWTTDSLTTSPIWNHIRSLAREEMNEQKLSYKQPDLFWSSYIRESSLR